MKNGSGFQSVGLVVIFLVCSAVVGLFLPVLSRAASTATNGIYTLTVEDVSDEGFGTYTVGTGASHPFPGENVLFNGSSESPWSTYLTVRSYTSSTDYVSTSSDPTSTFAVELLDNHAPVVTPLGSTGFTTTWSVNNGDSLGIEQVTNIEGTTINDTRVRVTTTVTNNGEGPVDIGIRYQWDWEISDSDDSRLRRYNPTDAEFATNFFEEAPPTFSFYEETNDIATFSVFATVNGPASVLSPPPTPPDRFNYSYWSDAFDAAWDFVVEGGDSDSGTCYYWGDTSDNAIRLAAGESYSVTQYLTTIVESIGGSEALTDEYKIRGGGSGGCFISSIQGAATTDVGFAGQGTGFLALFAVLGVVWAVRKPPWMLAVVACLGVLSAQPASALEGHTFLPAIGEDRLVTVESSSLVAPGTVRAGLFYDYAKVPVETTDNLELSKYQSIITASAGYGFTSNLQGTILVPALIGQNGVQSDLTTEVSDAEIGDIQLALKLTLVQAEQGTWGLAASPYVDLRTGAEDDWFGNDFYAGGIKLIVDRVWRNRTRLAANLGLLLRHTEQLSQTQEIGDMVVAALGLSHDLTDKIFATGELRGRTSLDYFREDYLSAVEVDLSLGYNYTPNSQFLVGVGAGNEGVGAPDWRLLIGGRFSF